SMTASDAIAATIRTILSGDDAMAEPETAAIAQQISATRTSGTRAFAVRCAGGAADGRVTDAPMASAAAITAVATNAPRQLPRLANVPPTSGPRRTETLQLVESSAIVRLQTCSGNVVRITT